MELTHRFTVPAGVDEAWRVFNDLRLLEPCFPGATITSIDGDDFAGSIKIKFGPITLSYEGSGRYVERNERAHQVRIEATGGERRTGGSADATVTATLSAADGGTAIAVSTDLGLTGRPAQLGQGVISDVSDRLLAQFVSCLSARFEAGSGTIGDIDSGFDDVASDTVELGVTPEELDGESSTADEPDGTAAVASAPSAASSPEPPPARPGPPPIAPAPRVTTSGASTLRPPTAEAPTARRGFAGPGDLSRPDFDVLRTIVPPLAKRFGPVVGAATVLAIITVRVYRGARR